MNRNMSRALWCALFVGGLTVLGATAASAAETGGDDAVASGNQVVNAITVPIALTGNAISVLGNSSSVGSSAVPVVVSGGADQAAVTDGRDGVASGNQVAPEVIAPVAVSGNAISVLGNSSSVGSSATPVGVTDGAGQAVATDGRDGVASGNQVAPDATAPVAVSGNAVSVLGNSSSGEPATVAPPATTVGDSSAQDPDRIRPISRMLAPRGDSTPPFEVVAAVGLAAVTGGDGFSVVPAPASGEPAGDAAVVPTGAVASVVTASADPRGEVSAADLSTQALANTGVDPGHGATVAALLLGAGLTLRTVARRQSLRL